MFVWSKIRRSIIFDSPSVRDIYIYYILLLMLLSMVFVGDDGDDDGGGVAAAVTASAKRVADYEILNETELNWTMLIELSWLRLSRSHSNIHTHTVWLTNWLTGRRSRPTWTTTTTTTTKNDNCCTTNLYLKYRIVFRGASSSKHLHHLHHHHQWIVTTSTLPMAATTTAIINSMIIIYIIIGIIDWLILLHRTDTENRFDSLKFNNGKQLKIETSLKY